MVVLAPGTVVIIEEAIQARIVEVIITQHEARYMCSFFNTEGEPITETFYSNQISRTSSNCFLEIGVQTNEQTDDTNEDPTNGDSHKFI